MLALVAFRHCGLNRGVGPGPRAASCGSASSSQDILDPKVGCIPTGPREATQRMSIQSSLRPSRRPLVVTTRCVMPRKPLRLGVLGQPPELLWHPWFLGQSRSNRPLGTDSGAGRAVEPPPRDRFRCGEGGRTAPSGPIPVRGGRSNRPLGTDSGAGRAVEPPPRDRFRCGEGGRTVRPRARTRRRRACRSGAFLRAPAPLRSKDPRR
jgi:hypothetical protein